ncbi:MAG: hypothetical protein ABDH21_00830 [bacterium]
MGNTEIPRNILITTTLKSFAKINWVLEILNKRKDNYHNISSIFDLINLYDTIQVTLIPDTIWQVELNVNDPTLKSSNLIYDLINQLNNQKTNQKYFVKIELEKRIPIGGGLGGGSSNVATILFYLYKQSIIDLQQAIRLCKSLGSDILPIFMLYLYPDSFILTLEKQNITIPIARNLSSFKLSDLKIYLITFPFQSSTTQAYQSYDKTIKNKEVYIGPKTYRFIYFNRINQLQTYLTFILHNDFEQTVFELYPTIGQLVEEIRNKIKEGSFIKDIKILLCGSGSSVAVICKNPSLPINSILNIDIIQTKYGVKVMEVENGSN